jgi:hypothetical protein
MDDPTPLRAYAALFEKILRPTEATAAAARALRYMADAIEQQREDDVTPHKLAATG